MKLELHPPKTSITTSQLPINHDKFQQTSFSFISGYGHWPDKDPELY